MLHLIYGIWSEKHEKDNDINNICNICNICNNKLNINDVQYFIKITNSCRYDNNLICYHCLKYIIDTKNTKYLKKLEYKKPYIRSLINSLINSLI